MKRKRLLHIAGLVLTLAAAAAAVWRDAKPDALAVAIAAALLTNLKAIVEKEAGE